MRWCTHISWRPGQFVLAAVTFVSLIGASPVLADTAPDRAAATRTPIIVAVPMNFPPWVISDPSGPTTGILKELWELWSIRTGIPVRLQPMSLSEVQEAVISGRADVADALVRTPERDAQFDFSEPHLETRVMLYFSEALAGVADARTARGFVVGVTDGDACISKLVAEGVDTIRKYPTHDAMVTGAVKNEIHLFCAQQPVANYFLNKQGKADAFRHSEPLYYARAHWVVRKGNQRVFREVSEGFAKISAKEQEAIISRWYGGRVERYALPLYVQYAGYILLALLAGSVLLAAWNRSLQRQVGAKTADLNAMLGDLQAAQMSLDEKNAALRQTLRDTVGALSAAMTYRDMSTAGHEHRVSELAVAIGRELGLDESRLEGLAIAATVHDIGQIQVPAEILTRPRRLSREEFELVKMHAQVGREILHDIQFPWPVAEIVYQHHENVDGSGYPRGLKQEAILLEARILRVADSVEAMLSHRPFRRATTIDTVVDELLAGKDRLYEGDVVQACIRLIEQNWQWFASAKKTAEVKFA